MIYFLQDSVTLHIKIGHTAGDDAEGRKRALQTGNPSQLVLLATMPGERPAETALHQRFAAARVAGEWFRPVPELLLLVCEARQDDLPPFDVPGPAAVSHVLRVYLAGKMDSGTSKDAPPGWRESLLPRPALFNPGGGVAFWPVRQGALLGQHDYVGPYFRDETGGHSRPAECRHGAGGDGYEMPDFLAPEERRRIRRCCLNAIAHCDVLFAWLDSGASPPDCYGTLAEVGYAHALGRKVWAASSGCTPQLWFVTGMAEWHDDGAASPLEAFSRAVAWDAARYMAGRRS